MSVNALIVKIKKKIQSNLDFFDFVCVFPLNKETKKTLLHNKKIPQLKKNVGCFAI